MTAVDLVITLSPTGVATGVELTRYGFDGCPRSVLHLTPTPVVDAIVGTARSAAREAWGLALGEPLTDHLMSLPGGGCRRLLIFDATARPTPTGDTETVLTPIP